MNILLIVYDNDSHISYFPLGIAYIAGAIRKASTDRYTLTIYNQDVYHFSEAHLTAYLNENHFDVVGMGACGGYYQYNKIKAICEAIHNSTSNPFVMIGGHLVSSEPEYFLRHFYCDAIVIGEGEETDVDLLDALYTGRDLRSVKGIAFLENNKFVQTQRRPLIEDLDSISMPAYDLFPIEHYALLAGENADRRDRYMPILSGRGCIFTCNFCYRMDKGFRPRTAQSIIAEIKYLQEKYHITYIDFCDELLMSSVNRTMQLCESFIESGIKFKWRCNGRLNFATTEVLEIMKRAGCVFINYGIESVNDSALKTMGKALTVSQIISGVKNTLSVGISPGLNIIFGNIGENQECLDNDVEFLLKYDDFAQLRTIRPVTPYPGSPLYDYAVEKGMIRDCEDFYENKHTNSDLLTVNFTTMTDDEFYHALGEANWKLLNHYLEHMREINEKTITKLYDEKDASFRGFRKV
jgi:radical SAM superfamily enzyme YgiQ (UPF0313 family)